MPARFADPLTAVCHLPGFCAASSPPPPSVPSRGRRRRPCVGPVPQGSAGSVREDPLRVADVGATKKGPPMTRSKLKIADHDEVGFQPEGVGLSAVRPPTFDPLRAHLVESGTKDRIPPPRRSPGPASTPRDPRRLRLPDPRGRPRATPCLVRAWRRHPGCVPHGSASRSAPSSLRRGPEARTTLPPDCRRVLDGAGTPGVSVRTVRSATSGEDLGIGARPDTTGSLDPRHPRGTAPLAGRRASNVDRPPAAGAGSRSSPGARAPARRCRRGRARDARRGSRPSRGGERRKRRGR